MDNAVDATLHHGFQGRIDVYTHDQDRAIVLRNNCFRRVAPLETVLQVFGSVKSDNVESIGENGVGVKQGCASLADTSFILTKNKRQYSIGVIAQQLQKQYGECLLPSFTMVCPSPQDMDHQLDQLMTLHPRELAECVRVGLGHGHFPTGRQQLSSLLQSLLQQEDDDYVFLVVLCNLLHGPPGELLNSFRDMVPRHYLNISSVNVTVNHEPVRFQYWERRLAALTAVEVRIDPHHPWRTSDDWHYPQKGNSVYLYMGFDALRCNSSKPNQHHNNSDINNDKASLLVYSRKSGRLIQHVEDARFLLSLPTGGTDFSQGLTVLLDDYQSTLPLTPTKQDLAFANDPNGLVHRDNLMAWVGAFCHLYYMQHLEPFGKKQLLRQAIENLVPTVQKLQQQDAFEPTLRFGDFNTLGNLVFRRYAQRIRCSNRQSIRHHLGLDTLIQFQPKTKKKPVLLQQQLQHQQQDDDDEVLPKKKRKVAAKAKAKRASKTTNDSVALPKEEEDDNNDNWPGPNDTDDDESGRKVSALEGTAQQQQQICELQETNARLESQVTKLLESEKRLQGMVDSLQEQLSKQEHASNQEEEIQVLTQKLRLQKQYCQQLEGTVKTLREMAQM